MLAFLLRYVEGQTYTRTGTLIATLRIPSGGDVPYSVKDWRKNVDGGLFYGRVL